jgi:hypothetical protein
MTFKGRDAVSSKILIDNKITEQVNCCNCLGNLISCETEMDSDRKLNKHLKITGDISNMFMAQKTLKKARIKLHSALVLPAVLYCSEHWTVTARDARRITAVQMKCVRKTAG